MRGRLNKEKLFRSGFEAVLIDAGSISAQKSSGTIQAPPQLFDANDQDVLKAGADHYIEWKV
jgi:hypothetical protein